MIKGFLLDLRVGEQGFLISMLRIFHFGITSSTLFNSSGTSLTLGIWRFMTYFTLEYKRPVKVDENNAGIS